jgi:hypothetical protein
MSRCVLIVALLVTRAALDQTVPPEDASALLTRAREKVVNSIGKLPKYTCLETIERAYYGPALEKRSSHLMTERHPASACSGSGNAHLPLDEKDRLRVEVAAAGMGEIHSWPGASGFDTRSFDQMIPFGPLSTGSFGTSLFAVFANAGAQTKFHTRKTDGSRDIFEYFFRVPLNASHFAIKGSRGWHITAFSGSFEINAASGELARLVYETDPLPPDTGMCEAKISTDYHFMRIGDGEYRIPQRSEFETSDIDGGQTDSVTEFSACHEYTAESRIRFDDQDMSAQSIKANPQRVVTLPPGLSLTLALVGAVDLGTAAAGDAISAKVVHPVRARGSKEILVPAGAIARGRMLEMRHYLKTSEFLISIRFDTLETTSAVSPLSVRLARQTDRSWSAFSAPPSSLQTEDGTPNGLVIRGSEFSLPPAAATERASRFVFLARRGTYVIPAGFQSKWTTVTP